MSSSQTLTKKAKKALGVSAPAKNIYLPPVFKDIFKPCRYKVYYGGRGSGKSWSIAQALVILAAQKKIRILCAREFQNSIKDSVHKLLKDVIERMGLESQFEITKDSIKSASGSEFMFKGLRHNAMSIRSTEGVDICWVEEAQLVSKESWETLIPTIRREGQDGDSEIWISFNPDAIGDPTYVNFVLQAEPEWIVRKVNFSENPFFPNVLRVEMERAKKNDFEAYLHIWEGEPKSVSDAVIFKDKFVCEGFERPEGVVRYFGADWGFSPDPLTAVSCFIKDDILYIEDEVYGVGVDLTDAPKIISSLPGAAEWPIRADSSAPGMIQHCQKNGLPNMRPARKPAGSIEDGIAFMRGLSKIVIHPRCKHAYEEFKLYSKKVDRMGNVLPIFVDKHNHCIDAIRYALEPEITAKHTVKTARITGF